MSKFHNQKLLQTLRSLTAIQPSTWYTDTQMSNKEVFRLILLNRQTNLQCISQQENFSKERVFWPFNLQMYLSLPDLTDYWTLTFLADNHKHDSVGQCIYLSLTLLTFQGFWCFARSRTREIQVFPRNPAKFPKKREIPRNPPEIFPTTCQQNIFNTYLGY